MDPKRLLVPDGGTSHGIDSEVLPRLFTSWTRERDERVNTVETLTIASETRIYRDWLKSEIDKRIISQMQ